MTLATRRRTRSGDRWRWSFGDPPARRARRPRPLDPGRGGRHLPELALAALVHPPLRGAVRRGARRRSLGGASARATRRRRRRPRRPRSTNARAAGERWRSRCQASAIRRGGISGSSSSTRIALVVLVDREQRHERDAEARPTRPCTVPLSSERKATSTSTPRCASSPSASAVLRQARLPIRVRSPSVGEARARRVRRARARPGRARTYGSREELERLERPVEERRHREREVELAALDEPEQLVVGRRLGQLERRRAATRRGSGASPRAAPSRRRSGRCRPGAGRPRPRRARPCPPAPRAAARRSPRRDAAAAAPASVSETARGPPGRSTQALADEPLERLDLLADRGLRVAERLGRPAERALARDRLERGQMAHLDAEPTIRFHDRIEQ